MIEDELLKWQFKLGSPDALRRIYEKYQDYLLTLAIALLNDVDSAEDVLHDVFVSFAESADKFRLNGSLKYYLTACVINRARDHYRSNKRQPLSLEPDEQIQSGEKEAWEKVNSNEQSIILSAALAELPYEQREAVTLHLKAGLRFKQIAKLQNIPVSTVQGRYRYGLDKLRTILNSEVEK
jgi:RNA polymerase sigma-70 factor (ECF subfamily)